MKGFTFIEFLLIMAIIVVLLALTAPLGINFYKNQQLDTVTEDLIQALRRAQLKSMSQAEYNFGIYLDSDRGSRYVLFRGNSYENRDDEENFDIPDNIYFNGLTEIVFSRLEGIPSSVGNIILTSDVGIRTININQSGRINY